MTNFFWRAVYFLLMFLQVCLVLGMFIVLISMEYIENKGSTILFVLLVGVFGVLLCNKGINYIHYRSHPAWQDLIKKIDKFFDQ